MSSEPKPLKGAEKSLNVVKELQLTTMMNELVTVRHCSRGGDDFWHGGPLQQNDYSGKTE